MPNPTGKGSSTTKAEIEQRLAYVGGLMGAHLTDSQVFDLIVEQYGVSRRQAQKYVEKLYARWEEDAKTQKVDRRRVLKERQRRRLLSLALAAQGHMEATAPSVDEDEEDDGTKVKGKPKGKARDRAQASAAGARWATVIGQIETLLMKLDGTAAAERKISYSFDPSQCTDDELDRIEAGESPITVLGPARVRVD